MFGERIAAVEEAIRQDKLPKRYAVCVRGWNGLLCWVALCVGVGVCETGLLCWLALGVSESWVESGVAVIALLVDSVWVWIERRVALFLDPV